MKRTLISMALLAASSVAMAGGVADVTSVTQDANIPLCTGDGTNGAKGGKTRVNGGPGVIPATPVFTRSGFEVQCSANVFLSYSEVNATAAAVGSTSAKGNQYFGGHSNGGAVGAINKCAATPCVQNDATTGLSTAKTQATATGS